MSRARLPLFGSLVALVLVLAAAGRVGALDLNSVLARSLYAPSEQVAVRRLFTEFQRMHLPADLLLPRLAEGVAKGVPFGRVEEALREDARFLEHARKDLASASGGSALVGDPAAWSLTATLIETGASDSEVHALATASRGASRAYRSGCLLYASLAGWGLSRERSLQVTLSALRSSLPPEQLLGIVSLFEEGRRLAIPPDRLAERLAAALPGVRDIEDLRRAVLY